MRKITILFMLWVIVITSVLACAPKTTGQGYDTLKKEVSAIFDELGATQGELQEAKEEIRATKNESSETKNKLSSIESTLTDKLTDIKELESKLAEADIEQDKYLSQYEELSIQYEELKEQYDTNVEGTTEINEEDVGQELFKLVNQERKNNGLSELIWNDGLYKCAQDNNRNMSETKSLVSSECQSFQQVVWFLGYGTTDRVANVALLAWNNEP